MLEEIAVPLLDRIRRIGENNIKRLELSGFKEARTKQRIVVDNPDKIETLMQLLDKMIDEDSSIITILVGQDIDEEAMNLVAEKIGEKFSDLDLDIRPGNQPVYSFLIGVE